MVNNKSFNKEDDITLRRIDLIKIDFLCYTIYPDISIDNSQLTMIDIII